MRREIVAAIAALENNDGQISPVQIVNAARDPSSVLHDEFEWNDSLAAANFRLDQARALLRRVEVHIIVHRREIAVPVYVRDPAMISGVQGYRSIVKIKTESDMAQEAVEREVAAVLSRLARLKNVAEALGLAGAVDELIDRVFELRGRAVPPLSADDTAAATH